MSDTPKPCKCGGNQLPNVAHTPDGCFAVPVSTRTPEVLTAEQVELLDRLQNYIHGKTQLNGNGEVWTHWLDALCALRSERESLRTALAQRTEERDTYKTLARVGRWHNECRPNRLQAARELQKQQAVIDKMADAVSEANRRAEQAEAALAQAREQRDAVLRDVAKLPSPWDSEARLADPETEFAKVTCWCSWCKVRVEVETTYTKWLRAETEELAPHPDTNCLWPRALAASGRGSAPQGDTEMVIEGLDSGIAHEVETLRQLGVETFESCQGGEGHAYPEPTVRFHGGQAEGPRAFGLAHMNGLRVSELRRVWQVINGELTGPWWELTFQRVGR